jgi:hypothetical protein
MKTRIFIGFIVLSLVAYAVISAVRERPFSPAADLPRGALVYLQFEDLPGFIKLWNSSDFKDKYLQSQNFDDLSKRHLGMKIASRWREFSDAAGFPIDLDLASGLADKRAAVAVYDIGKLDLVFIAPMKAELFEATKLMQNSDKFEDEQLDDGTHIYHVDVDADRGRQKQQILFTHVRNRLIIATSEKLLAQTISIITGRLRKNALADDPSFATLAGRTKPKTMTVWVDQSALNSDYYFKRYWLMSDVGSLKNIRSGMFDLSISDSEIVEDREFLLKETPAVQAVPASDSKQLLARVPSDAPYFKIELATTNAVQRSLASMLAINRPADDENGSDDSAFTNKIFYEDDEYDGDKFDRYINETGEDDHTVVTNNDRPFDLSEAIRAARPRAILTLERSRTEQDPLFIEFDKTSVITLASPGEFDRAAFERSVSDALAKPLLVQGQKLDGQWVTRSDGGVTWRQLDAPMLGWGVQYVVQGEQLIVADQPAFLAEVLATHENVSRTPFPEVTIVRPAIVRGDFQSTFKKLSTVKNDFFVGNILGLVDSAPKIEKIEIGRSRQGNLMREQLRMTFQPSDRQKQTTE